MNKKSLLTIIIGMILLLSFSIGQGLAQGKPVSPLAQNGPKGPNELLGQAFTYQGLLKNSSGIPITNTCGFRFRLYNLESGGSQLGVDSEVTGVSVTNGYFTAVVNLYGQFGSNAFRGGEARWLEVAVKCPTGVGAYVALSPLQRLNPTPFASYADPATHDHSTQTWQSDETVLTLISNDYSGLEAEGYLQGVYGSSTNPSGLGVFGSAPNTGVQGSATATTGLAYGVLGQSASPSGAGVYGTGPMTGTIGIATNTSGISVGVAGRSLSSYGIGVLGIVDTLAGFNVGVYGKSTSQNGTGVAGIATSTEDDITTGVYGETNSTGAGLGVNMSAGVRGEATHAGYTTGVLGVNHSTGGNGVTGISTNTTGYTNGVFGESFSSTGSGVYGANVNGGVAVGANGPIWSSAASILVLSPHAMINLGSSGISITPQSNGGVNIWSSDTGEKTVSLPVSTYGTLFGSQVYIKAVQVCYWMGNPSPHVHIDSTKVLKRSGTGYVYYIDDETYRFSEAEECYTVTDSPPYIAIDDSTWIQFALHFVDASFNVYIDMVKLTLVESSS